MSNWREVLIPILYCASTPFLTNSMKLPRKTKALSPTQVYCKFPSFHASSKRRISPDQDWSIRQHIMHFLLRTMSNTCTTYFLRLLCASLSMRTQNICSSSRLIMDFLKKGNFMVMGLCYLVPILELSSYIIPFSRDKTWRVRGFSVYKLSSCVNMRFSNWCGRCPPYTFQIFEKCGYPLLFRGWGTKRVRSWRHAISRKCVEAESQSNC